MTDVVRSGNTIRRRRYGWNTSTEGSLPRKKEKKKKNKVEEIQLANLASLGSLASKNGYNVIEKCHLQMREQECVIHL